MRLSKPFALCITFMMVCSSVFAQSTPLDRGSRNIHVVAHMPLGPRLSIADLDMEQELSRPYVYISRMIYGDSGPKGTDIISIKDPENPKMLLRWRIEDEDLHLPRGATDVKYFKYKGRYYIVQGYQFGQGGPNFDLGAVILDVTGLPDPSRVSEVARIYEPATPGGFHNIFVYKHSDGRVLLLSTVNGPGANVYDLGKVVEGKVAEALVARVPIPDTPYTAVRDRQPTYHDFYAAYHHDSGEDRFYGGGTGGYYVYDISNLDQPRRLATLTGIDGVTWGHTFTPSPDGRYVVAEAEYQYAPLRIFDLKPALDGTKATISEPISAWTANWKHLSHNHEVRWPFVFVSAYVDGLQIFTLEDPENPMTVGYYDTYIGPLNKVRPAVLNGAFGIDVRNADGLIVVSDFSSGLWVFRMDGFSGWNGEDWGVPNVSSVQNWDEGPGGTR